MSPTLNQSSALRCFERDNMVNYATECCLITTRDCHISNLLQFLWSLESFPNTTITQWLISILSSRTLYKPLHPAEGTARTAHQLLLHRYWKHGPAVERGN